MSGPVPVSPMAIEECALELIKAYDELRRRIDPTFVTASRHYRTFQTAAARLLPYGCDPWEYAHYVFALCAGTIPQVPFLASVKFIGAFVSERPKRLQSMKLMIELQLDDIRFRLDRGENLSKILNDPLAKFPPVLCWAVASTATDRELAGEFENDAKRQLKFEPAYGDLLRGWIPVTTEDQSGR